MSCLVTYFVPSYNHGPYIRDCIESIIAQDYSSIELLIIDDGSSDDSVKIIKSMISECEERFVRFSFFSQKNRGLVANINYALSWADGDFFAVLASDDVLFSGKTSVLLPYLNNQKLAGVTGGYIEIDHDSNELRSIVPSVGIWTFEDVLTRRARLFAPTATFRTSALRAVGGYWTDIPLDDRQMWLKLTNFGYLVQTTDHMVARYRRHAHNFSKSSIIMIEARMAIYDRFKPHFNLPRVRAKDLYGAARELAPNDIELALKYFKDAFKSDFTSVLTKSCFRAIKAIAKKYVRLT